MIRRVWLPVLLAGAVLASIRPSAALPVYRHMYEVRAGYRVPCAVCHVQTSWELNGFGQGFLNSGRSFRAFSVRDGEDSDKDGYSNAKETAAKSNPGDPASTPADPGPWLKSVPPLQPPKKRLDPLLGCGPCSYEVAEERLDPERVNEVEKSLGFALRDEDKHPVIFIASLKDGGPGVEALATYASTDGPRPAFFLVGLKRDGTSAVRFLKLPPDLAPGPMTEFTSALSGRRAEEMSSVAAATELPEPQAAAVRKAVMTALGILRLYLQEP